ncbi:MAG: hypothetical protein AABX51_08125 [Nanoarchaeota archaeon]
MKNKIKNTGTRSFIFISLAVLTLIFSLGMVASVLALESPAVAPAGSVWAWGSKGATGLGDGNAADSKIPVQLSSLSGVVDIAVGNGHALALKSDGTVWSWGLNHRGQLGDGTTTNRNTPVQVINLSGVVSIAAGASHSLAVKSDGSVWAWGDKENGQLGGSSGGSPGVARSIVSQPIQVPITGVISVAAGFANSIALKSDGTVWSWGSGSYAPTQVLGLTGIVDIATGGQLVALKSDGTVWQGFSAPVQVMLTGIVSIATGKNHGVAVKSDGTVWTWAHRSNNNYRGELGDGTYTSRAINTPVQVVGLTDVKSVAAGFEHSLALKSDGTVWSWGANYYGELGDGTNSNRNVPIQVSGLTEVFAVAASEYYSSALSTALTPVYDIAPLAPAPPPALTVVTEPAPIVVTETPPINDTQTSAKTSEGNAISNMMKSMWNAFMAIINNIRG